MKKFTISCMAIIMFITFITFSSCSKNEKEATIDSAGTANQEFSQDHGPAEAFNKTKTVLPGSNSNPLPANDTLIESITADSTLPGDGDFYGAMNLLRNNQESWVENQDDFGKGVKIKIQFKENVVVSEFSVKNGFGYYPVYKANNRIKTLSLICDDSEPAKVLLADNPGYQKVKLEAPVTLKTLYLVIEDVYPGDKYDDTCLNRITFNPWHQIDHHEENTQVYKHYITEIFDRYCDYMKDNFYYIVPDRLDHLHGDDFMFSETEIGIVPKDNGALIFVTQFNISATIDSYDTQGMKSLVCLSILDADKFEINQKLFPELKWLNSKKYQRTYDSVQKAYKTNAVIENYDIDIFLYNNHVLFDGEAYQFAER